MILGRGGAKRAVAAASLLLLASGCGSAAPGAVPAAAPPTAPPAATRAPATTPRNVPTPLPSVDRSAPPGWVDLATIDPTILVEIRYHGQHNFVGRPVAGYFEPLCLLPEPTARALATVQGAARALGYSLKVYDCYRPLRAGADFLAWAGTADETMRAEFYPSLTKRQLFSQGFIAGGRSAHSSGSAIDVTLVRLPAAKRRPYRAGDPLVPCTAPADQRVTDNSVDMGTGYDCFDARSHTLAPEVTGEARENRLLLRDLMAVGGFTNYAKEWWHYSLTGAPFRSTYLDFPVAAGAL